ncbi:MAG: hypothetical protein GY810_09625 [Aureispira sp.]|nr:hypothetical protein [Aureispira sp.]
MEIILTSFEYWQLTSVQLFMTFGLVVLGMYLTIFLLKKKQNKNIQERAKQELLKGYQSGNALRYKGWLRGMGSFATAIVLIFICSSWVYVDGGSKTVTGAAEEESKGEDEAIKMIGAISIVQAPDAKASTFLSSPSPDNKQAGYDDDEDYIRMTSYVYKERIIPTMYCPLATWDGQQYSPVPSVPDFEDGGCEFAEDAAPITWEFEIPDLLDNVDEVDLHNIGVYERQLELKESGAIMPLFPGCSDIDGNAAEKRICSGQKLYDYINAPVLEKVGRGQIPRQGWYVSFSIDREGVVKDIRVDVTDKELAKKLRNHLEGLNNLGMPWGAGTRNGEVVETFCSFPIGSGIF